MNFINELSQLIDQRLSTQSEASYISRLNQRGLNRMAQKCGEEACEVIIAAKDFADSEQNDALRQEVVAESADLFFHHLLLLRKLGISFDDVIAELRRRSEGD